MTLPSKGNDDCGFRWILKKNKQQSAGYIESGLGKAHPLLILCKVAKFGRK